MYPENWPRCPNCGDFALDGHITCGRAECDEGAARRRAERAFEAYRKEVEDDYREHEWSF